MPIRLLAIIVVLTSALSAQPNVFPPGASGTGGTGIANPTVGSVGAVTSLTINTTTLNQPSTATILVQCWTGTAGTGYTPVTQSTPFLSAPTISGGIVTAVTANFSSVGNVYCTANSSGGAGAAGANGTNGTNGSNGAGYAATSTTSLTIGTGSKTLTTQAGLAYAPGNTIQLVYTGNSADYMFGTVTSYSGGTSMVVNITAMGGSGTFSNWNITLQGIPGQVGGVAFVVFAAGSLGGNLPHSFGTANHVVSCWDSIANSQVFPPYGGLTLGSMTDTITFVTALVNNTICTATIGGGFSSPMTTQGDIIYQGVSGASRLADGTMGFHPDYYPSGCTVASVAHPQSADCAFALAVAYVNAGSGGAAIVLGPNQYLKNDAWVFPIGVAGPSPVNFPRYTVSIVGTDDGYGTRSRLVQNASIGSSYMVSAAPTAGTFISPNIRNVDFAANNNAAGCIQWGGVVRSSPENIDCYGFNGTGAGIQIGNVAGTSIPYEIHGSHMKVETTDGVEAGQTYAYGTFTIAGSLITGTNILSAGSGFGASTAENQVAVFIYGTSSGSGRACGTMPTGVTANIVGGAFSSFTFGGVAASGCVAPVYWKVTEMPAARFGFNFGVTDSTFDDIVSEGVGQIAGIYMTGAANVVWKPHAYYGSVALKDAGNLNTVIGAELDRVPVFDVALGGPAFYSQTYPSDSYANSSGFTLTDPQYIEATYLLGRSKFWLYTLGGVNSNIRGGTCNGTVGPTYNEFVTASGVANPNTTAYDTLLQPSLDVHNNPSCSPSTIAPQDRFSTGAIVNSTFNFNVLATPTGVTVTPENTGTTTYTYAVEAFFVDGSHSTIASATTTTGSNSSIGSSNYNTVAWTAATGAAYYGVEITTGPNATGIINSYILPTGALTAGCNNTSSCAYQDITATGSGTNFNTQITAGSLCFSTGTGICFRQNSAGTAVTAYSSSNAPLMTLTGALVDVQALQVNTGNAAPTATITAGSCTVSAASGTPGGGTLTVTAGGTGCALRLAWANSVTYTNDAVCSPLQDVTLGTFSAQAAASTTVANFSPMTWVTSDVLRYGPCLGR